VNLGPVGVKNHRDLPTRLAYRTTVASLIGAARVSAFGRGPTHGYRNFIRSHGSDVQPFMAVDTHRWH